MLAIGLDFTPDRLNDLLVLLAVLMIEAGGGLSLSMGMALGRSPGPCGQMGRRRRTFRSTSPNSSERHQPRPQRTTDRTTLSAPPFCQERRSVETMEGSCHACGQAVAQPPTDTSFTPQQFASPRECARLMK